MKLPAMMKIGAPMLCAATALSAAIGSQALAAATLSLVMGPKPAQSQPAITATAAVTDQAR